MIEENLPININYAIPHENIAIYFHVSAFCQSFFRTVLILNVHPGVTVYDTFIIYTL